MDEYIHTMVNLQVYLKFSKEQMQTFQRMYPNTYENLELLCLNWIQKVGLEDKGFLKDYYVANFDNSMAPEAEYIITLLEDTPNSPKQPKKKK